MIKCTATSISRGERRLISDFTFEFLTGIYVVKGPNGSGKSTFLLSLLGEVPLAGGSVTIDGRDLVSLSDQGRCATYSWYEDQEIAFNFTAKDVLGWGGWSIGMADELVAEELLDRQWKRLSRGERARVLLTTVLAKTCPHYLLDEPAAGLDDSMILKLASILTEKARDGAVVIISEHDLRLISALDAKVLTIHGGLLTE